MREILKRIIKSLNRQLIIFKPQNSMKSHLYRMRLFILDSIIETLMRRIRTEEIGNVPMKFVAPNYISDWRAQTFRTKEPETIDWIDQMEEESIFWDIGANVGIFSIYGAKKRNLKVYSFEPSVFNLELLARNIFANKLNHKICIMPFPLSLSSEANTLNLSSTKWGGALSTFGENFGWDGAELHSVFETQLYGMSIDDLINKMGLPTPKYIKIDVDGLEHIILKGGREALAKISSILIEVNERFEDQANNVQRILTKAGFHLKSTHLSEFEPNENLVDNKKEDSKVFNQIWSK